MISRVANWSELMGLVRRVMGFLYIYIQKVMLN